MKMNKILFIIILPFVVPGFPQDLQPILNISEKDYIQGSINMIEQGMKQHKNQLITGSILENIIVNKVKLDKNSLDKNIEKYFVKSNGRKKLAAWKELTPDTSLPANFDFKIDIDKIEILDNIAIVNLKFYWMLDIPILDGDLKIQQPGQKIKDTWSLVKNGNRWQLYEAEKFLYLFFNSDSVKEKRSNYHD